MALFPPLGHEFPPEPVTRSLGAPRELDVAGHTICPAPEEETSRLEHVQAALGPPEHFMGELKSTESATSSSRLPLASSHECQDGDKPCEVLRALGTHRDTIFQRLWQLQAQLISYSLVLEKPNLLDQDLEVEGDSDGPAAGGVWGPWAPSTFPTPAELEWDPAGDVGGLGPAGQKLSRIPGGPCELCGYRGPQSSGQGLEVRSAPPSKAPCLARPHKDLLSLGLSHRKHLAAHHRRRLRKSQDKKRQVSPSLPEGMLEVDHGVPAPASKRPLTLFFILLFLLLVGATLLLPLSGVSCCSHTRLARTPYLVLSYVNGLPPV